MGLYKLQSGYDKSKGCSTTPASIWLADVFAFKIANHHSTFTFMPFL